jgi:hypothetical protein
MDAITVFNGLLVIVTGGLVVVGLLQVQAMRKIADRQTRDTEGSASTEWSEATVEPKH